MNTSTFKSRLDVCRQCSSWSGVCLKGHSLHSTAACPDGLFGADGFLFGSPKVSVYPVLGCNQRCSYCIQQYGGPPAAYGIEPGHKWVSAFNRMLDVERIHMNGGEVLLHPDIVEMVAGINPPKLTLLQLGTNGSAKSREALSRIVDRGVLMVSMTWHRSELSAEEAFKTARLLRQRFARVTLSCTCYPGEVLPPELGDFAPMPLLSDNAGWFRPGVDRSMVEGPLSTVECCMAYRPIAPDGTVYACHALCYARSEQGKLGNIFEGTVEVIDGDWIKCDHYGACNPCDVGHHKIRTV